MTIRNTDAPFAPTELPDDSDRQTGIHLGFGEANCADVRRALPKNIRVFKFLDQRFRPCGQATQIARQTNRSDKTRGEAGRRHSAMLCGNLWIRGALIV